MPMNILITGADGMLGTNLIPVLDAAGHTCTGIDIGDADIARPDEIIPLVLETAPDLVIHAAACTDLAACEKDPAVTWRVNALGTRNIALACGRAGCAMAYISTDYIFGGNQTAPHREFDDIDPQSAYARSKYAGEEYVRSLLDRFFIIRTAGLFGEPGKNFVKSILAAARAGKELRVVSDETANRTYVPDLAEGIRDLVATGLYGIYHIANGGACSWYDFAREILKQTGLLKTTVIHPIAAADYGDGVVRPANSTVDMLAFEEAAGRKMRPVKSALKAYLKSIS